MELILLNFTNGTKRYFNSREIKGFYFDEEMDEGVVMFNGRDSLASNEFSITKECYRDIITRHFILNSG